MRKDVEEYLSRSNQMRTEARRRERDAFLLEQGLCQIEFMEEGGDPSDYPEFEDGKQCRKTPLALTEEEYAAVRAAAEARPGREWPVWPVHKILFVLAMITWAGGFVLGLASQMMGGYGGFSLVPAASMWFGFMAYGALLLAASEIVRLMKKLNREA